MQEVHDLPIYPNLIKNRQVRSVNEAWGTKDLYICISPNPTVIARFAEAHQIVFLGFGYGETNLKRLVSGVIFTLSVRIVGSMYGLSLLEQQQIRSKFSFYTGNNVLNNYLSPERSDLPVMEYLRHFVTLE